FFFFFLWFLFGGGVVVFIFLVFVWGCVNLPTPNIFRCFVLVGFVCVLVLVEAVGGADLVAP
ncbi:hypothetical protein, partial [Erwinia amylovora]|uniref:hypothetical protein n=1 Tax=Erwinia amylovora TaxID=552 RepID=UPI0020BDC9EA